MGPYYNNITADSTELRTFTQTLSNPSFPAFKAISSLSALAFDISPSGNINLTTNVCGYPTNGIDFCVLTMSISRISDLNMRYIALSNSFTKINHFYR